MVYNCKLIVSDNKYLFNIYIKYRPKNSIGFYKKYYILKQGYPSVYGLSFKEQLTSFNKLSMEDIKEMLIKYIKDKENKKKEDKKCEDNLQYQIKLSNEKVSKFTIET